MINKYRKSDKSYNKKIKISIFKIFFKVANIII